MILLLMDRLIVWLILRKLFRGSTNNYLELDSPAGKREHLAGVPETYQHSASPVSVGMLLLWVLGLMTEIRFRGVLFDFPLLVFYRPSPGARAFMLTACTLPSSMNGLICW